MVIEHLLEKFDMYFASVHLRCKIDLRNPLFFSIEESSLCANSWNYLGGLVDKVSECFSPE